MQGYGIRTASSAGPSRLTFRRWSRVWGTFLSLLVGASVGFAGGASPPDQEGNAVLPTGFQPGGNPELFTDPGADFWKAFGVGVLTLPAPAAPVGAARLVVARRALTLGLADAGGPPSRWVPAALTFYEGPNDLQMQLDLPEVVSCRYLGVTGPHQVELCLPGTALERAQRLPVQRCGLIQVLARNADGSTRLVFRLTPAGSFELLTDPGTGPLYARIYKGGGLPGPARQASPPRTVKAIQIGVASWYGTRFQGRRTASGEKFNPNANTAAHRTLPLGTTARVTNLHNGKSTVVRITDRGPASRRRLIDVSRGVADRLGFRRRGTARVKVEVLEPPKAPR